MGECAFFSFRRLRGKTLRNLKFALGKENPPAQIKAIVIDVFRNLGENFFEILSIPKFNSRNIDKYVKINGLEIIHKVLSQKRGFIVLSGHFGNWELLAGYFGLKGYPVTVLARRLRYKKFDKFINTLRNRMGVKVIYRDDSAKAILKTLKNGGSLAILADQDIVSVDGVFVDFFGYPAYTPTAPVAIALSMAVPIIPMFIVKEKFGHRIYVEDPLELEITGNKEVDLKVNTEKWSKVEESYIRRYPSQWVWMHDRWKTKETRRDE